MRPVDYLILGLIVLALAAYKLRTALIRRGSKPVSALTARAVEREVQQLLNKRGYEIIAARERASYQVVANGRLSKSHLEADLIVEKDGRRYAALIDKAGEEASFLARSEGRVRLLPWQAFFGTQGVLVIDPEGEKIHTVNFKLNTPGQKDRYLLFFLFGAVTGAATTAILLIFKGG